MSDARPAQQIAKAGLWLVVLCGVVFPTAYVFSVHPVWLHGAGAGDGFLQQKIALLEEDNERMRAALQRQEKEAKLARNHELRAEIERQVEKIRGLAFEHPVEYAVVTKAQIRDVVAGKLAEMYSEQDFVEISAALARLGFVPEGYPLRQRYIELLGEQIAAFYDQHSHKLFMFEDASLETTQNRVVLAHELTHALQDQHFGLLKLPLEIKTDDDRALAASALVEGDATQVMSDYMLLNFSLAALKESAGSALTQNTEQLGKAPRYLRELLLFPYLRGQAFCATFTGDAGGYGALDPCYARLPGSTAEILHPERYAAHWEPELVAWSDPSFEGKAPTISNAVGEAALRIQLSPALEETAAAALAAQWKGDRYLHFGPLDALVWKTRWKDAEAAEKFRQAEGRVLEARYGAKPARGLRLASPAPGTVVLVDAPTAEAAGRLWERFALP